MHVEHAADLYTMAMFVYKPAMCKPSGIPLTPPPSQEHILCVQLLGVMGLFVSLQGHACESNQSPPSH